MGIVIREADLVADHETLLGVLLRNREHGDNELRRARFQWSYFENPFGQPRAWLAFNSSSRVIGMAAVFPRQIKVNGTVVQAWNGGDTSVDKEFRTLGVAIKLRQAVKACVNPQEMSFLYSYPVDRMRVVLERIGHRTIGSFVRHGAILRSNQLLQEYIGPRPGVALLARVANLLLPLQWSYRFSTNRFRVHLQQENAFGDEFDDLYQRVCLRYPVMTVRDAAFLNWRFVKNPNVRNLHIFRFEEEGTLQGYAVVGLEKSAARILDILVDGDHRAIRALLLGLIRWLRSYRICTLSLLATATSPLLKEARPLGFLFQDRRDAGITVYTPNPVLSEVLMDEKNWYMTPADRDV